MKNLTKRIISSVLCAAVTAANAGVCGVTAVDNDTDAAVNSGVRGVTASVATTPKSAGGTTGSAIFSDRETSELGNDSESIAIKTADPYGTTDSSGNGQKWKALSVVPEVYTMYGNLSGIIDYNDGNATVSNIIKTRQDPYMQVSAGLDLGSGKNDAVVRFSYEVEGVNNNYGSLYLEICDPQDGGGKTDGNFTVSWSGKFHNTTISGSKNMNSLKSVSENSGAVYNVPERYSISASGEDGLVQLDQNIRGQYLSMAAGDFDGDGIDTVVAYIPSLSLPSIREYQFSKKNVSTLNEQRESWYDTTKWTFSGANYYWPKQTRTVSSNVYNDFNLEAFAIPSYNEGQSRNFPIVDIVAADVDRDGCDELIVTAGLGDTTTGNGSKTVMKIYDLVNGTFRESYTQSLSDNYNGQQGRIRWASSAVGNVFTGSNGSLSADFPEIVTAGWVDVNDGTGISMKRRFGVHVTEITGFSDTAHRVGIYRQKMILGTSENTIDSAGSDGISEHMKNGFPDWTRHDRLAVGTLAYKGPAAQAAIMLGDTVYDITSENKLSAAYWSKDISDHTHYSVRKLLTGNYAMGAGAVESAYFLCADNNNSYAAYMYYYKNGAWHTKQTGSQTPNYYATIDVCNIDIDNDSMYVKLNKVEKTWADPKPLYILEAAPYFSEFPDSQGTTTIGFGKESGEQYSWSAGISASAEVYFSQDIAFILKFGHVEFGDIFSTTMTYEGSLATSQSVDVEHFTQSENVVLVERTPRYVYRYDVMGTDNKFFDVVVTGNPETALISVDEYNTLAANFNSTKENDRKLTLIDSSFGLGTPGDPLTYRRNFPTNELVTSDGGASTAAYYGAGNGGTTKTISQSSTLTNGYSIEISDEAYFGADYFGVGAKYSFGVLAGTGGSFFHTDSVSCGGTVGHQSKNNLFDFNWDVARWVNNGIPVVGYKLTFNESDIQNLPPVTPRGLEAVDTSNNSVVTLKWTDPATATGRKIADHVRVYYRQSASETNYTEKYVALRGTAGEHTLSLDGLVKNTKYNCYIKNCYETNGSITESYQSDPIEFTTANNPNYVSVNVSHGKGVTLHSGREKQIVDKDSAQAITEIVYYVNDGYNIPNHFYQKINNITVQAVSNGDVITVSGIPTDDTAINIPDMDLIEYGIYYHDGGEQINYQSYTVESDTITLPEISKKGCIFQYWKDKQMNVITEIPAGSQGDKELHAQWIYLDLLGYRDGYPADGSARYPYIIRSENGWNLFCDCLENNYGGCFDDFSGKHVRLDNDIIVTRMAGSSTHPFNGIFDGCGHTLTFNYTASDDYTAPFRYVKDGTIENLHVDGTVTTDSKYTGGFVGMAKGSTTITNSISSIIINSSVVGDGKHGGFIGSVESGNKSVSIEGCLFNGTFTGENTGSCGGFIGWNSTGTRSSVTNSLFAPTLMNLNLNGESENFACNGITLDNCYYTTNFKGTQGKQIHTITAGQDVTLALAYSDTPTVYSLSGIAAYNTGIIYDNTFYAGEGDDIPLTLTYSVTPATGYQFGGYSASAGTLNDNILTMPDADVTITGGNVGNTYFVRFNANTTFYYCGNEKMGTMPDQTFTYGEEKALAKNDYNQTTASVINWNTKADGTGTTYTDEQRVQNLTPADGDIITLYAQWKNQLRVSYDYSSFETYNSDNEKVNWFYPGETVRVNAKNYWCESFTVTGEDGTPIDFDETAQTFIMPSQPVQIEITVEKIAKTQIYLDGRDTYDDTAYFYNASNPTVTPTVTVKDGDKTLTENTDYTVSITNNVGSPDEMVKATVTITGMGSYTGTNERTFRICAADIAKCEIKGDFKTYDNGYGVYYPLADSVEVWNGYTRLEIGTDYYLGVELPGDDTDYCYVGGRTYQGTITGTGSWGGTKTFEFTVLAHTIVFYAGDGTGTMADGMVTNEQNYILPECGFTAPYGCQFDGWRVDGETNTYHLPGFKINGPRIESESDVKTITVEALWREKPKYTITLPENVEAVSGITDGRAYKNETITFRIKEGDPAQNAQANGISLTAENGIYAFYVTDDTVITTHTPVVINSVDINGLATPTIVYKEGYKNTDYTVPTALYLSGYSFAGWTVNGTLCNMPDEVQTAVANLVAQDPVPDITVAVVYTQKTDMYDISFAADSVGCTIRNALGEVISNMSAQCQVSEQLYATADQAAPGQKFSHWERRYTDGRTVIVGYEKTYSFRMPEENMTLCAVYVNEDTKVNKLGTAYIESVSRIAENQLSFISILGVPNGCRMIQAGAVVDTMKDLDDKCLEPDELTIEDTCFASYDSVACQNSASFKYTLTLGNLSEDNTLCVRAYLLYEDADGTQHKVYGEPVCCSISDFSIKS